MSFDNESGDPGAPEPVKVEVVRPKERGFRSRALESIPMAIAISLLTTFFLALAAPRISAYVSLFHPSCADPRGLTEVPSGSIHATGPTQAASERWSPDKVTDGRVADLWVPVMLPPAKRAAGISKDDSFAVVDRSRSTLTLALAEDENVQLVCVVNGLANSYSNYVNWSRVRAVQTWTDNDSGRTQSTLNSMDESSFQEFQDVEVPTGDARRVMVQVLDLYEGQQVTSVDPDVCDTRDTVGVGIQNDPVGCNLNAAKQGGLAEVKVYALKTPRWKTLVFG
jgi:hypothetical protein